MASVLISAPARRAETLRTDSVFPYDDVHPEEMNTHDPSVALVNGVYCLVATSRDSFVPIWTSRDRVHWKYWGPVLPDQPNWLQAAVPQHTSIWAPAPLLTAGKFRIYYCASQKFGSNTSFIGMAENDRFDPDQPTQGWVDKGKLIESDAGKDNFNAIDPDVCTGPDGRQWMVYGSYWSGIYEMELDPETGLLKSGATPVHVASNTGERGNPLEAPFLRFHNGYYYLCVTYGLAAQGVHSTYRMMIGRSKEPEGPFVGFDGTPMTEGGHTDLLKSSPPMFAPGGGNMFEDAKGDWWLAYHYYDSTKHWVGDIWGRPTLQIRKVVWGADGWPLPGLPDGVRLEHANSIEGPWEFQTNFGDPVKFNFHREGWVTQDKRSGLWKAVGGHLTITWPSGADEFELDESNQYMVGRTGSGVVVRGVRLGPNLRRL
jgi:arabinan endo-1,5-alpha-L-arabinosidase